MLKYSLEEVPGSSEQLQTPEVCIVIYFLFNAVQIEHTMNLSVSEGNSG